MVSDNAGTAIVLDADDIYLGNEWTFDKASGTQQFNNGSVMKVIGGPFGTSLQFISWFGPPMALSSCAENNGKSWEKTDGDAYFGGSLSAGTLSNATQTADTSPSAQTEMTFGSNGGQIHVTISYSYAAVNTSDYPYTTQGVQQYNAAVQSYGGTTDNTDGTSTGSGSDPGNFTIQVYRGVNGGALSLLNTFTGRGSWTLDGTRPLPGDQAQGVHNIYDSASGSWSFYDPDQSTEQRTYQVILSARNQEVIGTSGNTTQRIEFLATEG